MYKLMIDYPDQEHLREIARKTTGTESLEVASVVNPDRVTAMQRVARRTPIAADFVDAAVRVVRATHPANAEAPEPVRRFVRFGASPRAVQAIILGAKVHALLMGRYHVSTADLAAALRPSLRHRILLNFEAATSAVGAEQLFPELEKRLLR
jgi:MoxR-like ATPase